MNETFVVRWGNIIVHISNEILSTKNNKNKQKKLYICIKAYIFRWEFSYLCYFYAILFHKKESFLCDFFLLYGAWIFTGKAFQCREYLAIISEGYPSLLVEDHMNIYIELNTSV